VRWVWLPALICATGCPWGVPAPVARVGHGPAFQNGGATLAALPVRCAPELRVCARPYAAAIASATRMNLELTGYTVVDTELLNAEARRRTTTRTEPIAARVPAVPQHGVRDEPIDRSREEVELSGGLSWADAPPEERRRMLIAMGVDGVLATEVGMGPPRGMARQRTLTMRVTITRLDGDLIWRSECDVETGDYRSDEQAVDQAARCAVESASLW
jgi:hypothetical protein